ncbi:helix-turn-helix domain-containing protein [Pseudonocardia alni]|uniref:AraC-like DNA-binding protein n=1 Tax=Pseudonocardia alni TaxID=33907 RepID=A0A852VWS3_PSEA5|nr:helix-turn-helix domain-containing protein [Pseudonocardia antarctica]NYG01273.1 AraC-like DNA-binding protein [Pseudonocardia antarctica]
MRIDTSALAPHRQARHWQSVISDVYVPLEFRPHTAGSFAAELEVHRVDDLEVSTLRADPHAVVRAPDRDAATIFVMLPRSGVLHVEQDGRTAVLSPGDLASYDASRACLIESPEPFDLTVLKVPAERFRTAGFAAPPSWSTAVRIGAESPVGSLTAPFVLRLAELGRVHDHVGVRASTIALLAAALGSAGEDPGDARAVLRARATAVLRDRLGDPSLDPARIAAALHVSLRTLQVAFAEVGASPARELLAARLDRAADLLADPAGRTVTEVAHAVGFGDPSQFSRSFKARHGASPRDWRDALRESATAPARTHM